MSVESLAIALHHSRASGTAKLVLIGIANHDGDGGAWPSVATLAHYAAVDVRATQKAINRLEALGEIRREVQAGGLAQVPDYRRPNLYRFLLTCPHNCDRTRNHRTRPAALFGDPDPLSQGTPGVPTDGGRVSQRTPKPSLEPKPRYGDKRTQVLNREDRHPDGHKWMPDTERRYCEFGHPTQSGDTTE